MRASMVILAALACAMPRMASAQDQSPESQATPDQVISHVLDGAGQVYLDNHYAAGGWEHRGTLAPGASEDLEVSLSGGTDYQFLGACELACSNFDFTLIDAAGQIVESDTEEDDAPIVTAALSGDYTLRVTMVACESETCSYGARMYRK